MDYHEKGVTKWASWVPVMFCFHLNIHFIQICQAVYLNLGTFLYTCYTLKNIWIEKKDSSYFTKHCDLLQMLLPQTPFWLLLLASCATFFQLSITSSFPFFNFQFSPGHKAILGKGLNLYPHINESLSFGWLQNCNATSASYHLSECLASFLACRISMRFCICGLLSFAALQSGRLNMVPDHGGLGVCGGGQIARWGPGDFFLPPLCFLGCCGSAPSLGCFSSWITPLA
jgi:hypothetical protein